jgi:hypothetical protein|mmetsp:Transcript_3734/g.7139  ORF Transcript_3734/g.7139 Transcript_3734/m.7139 type:complete len:250 (-) Transcript_3734:497-1246(-)
MSYLNAARRISTFHVSVESYLLCGVTMAVNLRHTHCVHALHFTWCVIPECRGTSFIVVVLSVFIYAVNAYFADCMHIMCSMALRGFEILLVVGQLGGQRGGQAHPEDKSSMHPQPLSAADGATVGRLGPRAVKALKQEHARVLTVPPPDPPPTLTRTTKHSFLSVSGFFSKCHAKGTCMHVLLVTDVLVYWGGEGGASPCRNSDPSPDRALPMVQRASCPVGLCILAPSVFWVLVHMWRTGQQSSRGDA